MISLAVWHEYTWWKKRHWTQAEGIIIGFKANRDSDGVSYNPEIEFKSGANQISFISIYGSGKKPTLGAKVEIFVDESGQLAEHYSFSNRMLFTLVPIIFGIIFITLGLNIEPVETSEKPPQIEKESRS